MGRRARGIQYVKVIDMWTQDNEGKKPELE